MVEILGYDIDTLLYESDHSLVYRGRRQSDKLPVVLKMLRQAYPSPEKAGWFTRECELTRSLETEGVIRVHDLMVDQHRPVMVLEDFGGESLAQLMQYRRLTIGEFLHYAIQIVEVLGRLHQKRIIHKDITPSNLIVNTETGIIKLIDFGISTIIPLEQSHLRGPGVLEGTLAYMSPEQTGRMNRAVDYRSDFYALGATFYEMLSGQVPFDMDDAMELVHAHIAMHPTSLHLLDPAIPEPLNDIVARMMAKNAEDRYQSAFGLKADLEHCRREWESRRTIAPFAIGGDDVSDQFRLSQKLYGREQEVRSLLDAFDRVSAGSGELILVSGDAGIGKSVLVQEIYKPVTRQRGYFIAGKFDLLQRNIPHASLVQALESLIGQILTESEADVAAWRQKILDAVGTTGQSLIDLVPEIEQIIGPQPAIPVLSSAESQNRLNRVLERFIGVFATPDHPLVMFLDDLQWADSASLHFLEFLMTASGNRSLLIIGAYRDTEVGTAHPLMLTIDAIRESGLPVQRVALSPLGLNDVIALIADTLHSSPPAVDTLARLVVTKTNGNPFFMGEFLKSLYAEGLIAFNYQNGIWEWDNERIQARDMTDNVVTLMTDRMRSLTGGTRDLLPLAACIGNRFNIQMLSLISDRTPREVAHDLREALDVAMVVPLGDAYKLMELDIADLTDSVSVEYKFAHDRIYQAAYSLIPEEHREAVHLRIGRVLRATYKPGGDNPDLFDVANQLNSGRRLIDDSAERLELAEWNLKAGRKAKEAAAYSTAYEYFDIGLTLLGEDAWEQHYDLALALSLEATEAAYLGGSLDRMEQLIETVLNRAVDLLDKVAVYEIQLLSRHNTHRHAEAIDVGLKVLELLDVALPAAPGQPEIFQGLQEVMGVLEGKEVEALLDLPEMTDAHTLAAVRILARLYSPAYVANPALYPLIVCKIVYLSVVHGNSPHAPRAYASYGMILCGVIGDINTGYRFGTVALKLADRFWNSGLQAGALFIMNAFVRHWKEHIRESLKPLLDTYQVSLDTGDLEFAALSAFDYGFQLYWSGMDLRRLEPELARFSEAIDQIKQGHAWHLNELYRQAVLNMQGKSDDPKHLVGSSYNELEMLPMFQEFRDYNALCQVYLNKALLCVLFEDYRQAAEHTATAEQYIDGVMGTPAVPACYFYDTIARASLYEESSETEQEAIREKIAANIGRMKAWGDHAPMNFRHKWALMQAEYCNIQGEYDQARDYYDQAIDLAREHGYINEEALANERAFRFFLSRGQQRIAGYYLRDAQYAYLQWGAEAKINDLRERYPRFLREEEGTPLYPSMSASMTKTAQQSSDSLDIISILKASQAISGEIVLDKLLARLTRIAIENAGARSGCIILEKRGKWVVESEANVDQDDVTVMQSIPLDPADGSVPRVPLAIINYVTRTRELVVLDDATTSPQFSADTYITRVHPRSVLCVPLINQNKLHGILYLENNLSTGVFTADRLEVLKLLSTQAAISIEVARLYTDITALNKAYARFVPQQFLSFLGKESIVDVQLGDQVQKEMTIMFSDIRNFTTISEQMSPAENFAFLNDYFGRMEPLIVESHGFIDKYIGDSIMSLFPTNADDALQAAIRMIRELALYNRQRMSRGDEPIQIGLGLHTGMLMLGTVGGLHRMDGTVISDAVNVASRVEGLTKRYGVPLLLTEGTYRRLQSPGDYLIRELDRVRLKGKSEPITLYEVFEGDPDPVLDLKRSALDDFQEALTLYRDQDLENSRLLFERVWKRNPDDMAALLFLRRCDQLQQQGLPPDWDGVEVLFEK